MLSAEQRSPDYTFEVHVNNRGVGYPGLLFSDVRAENPKLSLSFWPPSLEKIAVCEPYSDRQESFLQIMEKYLERYSACFLPVRENDKWELRPNRTEQLLEIERNGEQQFACKCAPAQLP